MAPNTETIPRAPIAEILRREIAKEPHKDGNNFCSGEGPDCMCGVSMIAERLEAAGQGKAEAWKRRLPVFIHGRVRDKKGRVYEQAGVSVDLVDRLLTGLELFHEWTETLAPYLPPLPPPEPVVIPDRVFCEDCGKGPLAEGEYRILDLIRPDPNSTSWIWNATHKRWIYRPKSARPGGRRFRKWTLCRFCAAEVLRKRAHRNGQVKENGVKRALKRTERIAPKRGGRPPLLDEHDLRRLHAIYIATGCSMLDLAKQLAEQRGRTVLAYQQRMRYGWERLGLNVRPRNEQIRLSLHRRGFIPPPPSKRCAGTRTNGKRCTQRTRDGDYCHWHTPREEEAA